MNIQNARSTYLAILSGVSHGLLCCHLVTGPNLLRKGTTLDAFVISRECVHKCVYMSAPLWICVHIRCVRQSLKTDLSIKKCYNYSQKHIRNNIYRIS